MAEAEKLVIQEPILRDFKKFLGACEKLAGKDKFTRIDINEKGMTLLCGTDFNIVGTAKPEKFFQFPSGSHKTCNILMGDIHDLISKDIDRLEIIPQDGKLKVDFIRGMNKIMGAEIGEPC